MKTNLHFWDLPEKTMFWLKDDFWDKLHDFKKRKKMTWRDIEESLEISGGTLKNYFSQSTESKRAQFIPLKVFIKISNFLEINHQEAERSIIKVKYGKNGKPIIISFPINFLTQEWAGLVGAILAEGYIGPNLNVGFWNTDTEILNNFTDLAKKITPEGLKVSNKLYGCFFPAIFGQILVSGLSLRVGNKTEKDVRIPFIYSNSKNKQIIRSVLSWLFTGDGYLTFFEDHLGQTHRAIGIGFGSPEKDVIPNLLANTMKLLDHFKIRYSGPYQEIKKTKTGKTTYSWRIFIRGKKNLLRFKENVGFQSYYKEKTLRDAIDSYIRPKLGDNESLDLVINAVTELFTSGKVANKHMIAKLTNLRVKWIERLLKKANDMKLVEVIGGGEKIKGMLGGRNPYIYKPSDITKGKNR